MNKTSKTHFYISVIFYIVLSYFTLGYGDELGPKLFDEDKYFENIGALSLFIASVVMFFVVGRAFKHRIIANIHWIKLLVYFGFAFLFFFGAGEEISWGQRIFNIDTPVGLVDQNMQEELNLHNLNVFEGSDLLKSDTLFTLFWMVSTVFLPVLALSWNSFKQFSETFIPIVHWTVGLLFIFNYLVAKLAERIYVSIYAYQEISFIQAVQEIKESNYAVLFVFFSFFVLWDLNRLISKKLDTRI